MGNCFGKKDLPEDERPIHNPNISTSSSTGLSTQQRTRNADSLRSSESYIRRNAVLLDDQITGRELEQKYELNDELGRGANAITYMCIDKESGERFACKVISKRRLPRRALKFVRREVEIMRHLPKHPNIVSLKETYEDNDAVYLVMELCEGGELFERIVSGGPYSEREAAKAIRTIVEVVEICHRNGVIHRDLKPENFCYTNKSETASLKAIDFGISTFFKPGEIFDYPTGSLEYMAPEVLNCSYGPEIDIWSAGVILYTLLTGGDPWQSDTDFEMYQKIQNTTIDFSSEPWLSENAKDLVRKMLNRDPRRRLTAQEVLEHPWLRNESTSPHVSFGEEVKARLRQFCAMNKFKKLALSVIAEYLSAEEIEGLKEGFKKMDASKRGKINSDELRAGLQSLGYHAPEADLQTVVEAADDNKDGYLDYKEFVPISVYLKKLGNDEHLHKAFDFLDLNKNGYIEIEELMHFLKKEVDENGEEVINAIMQDVDTNKDGMISYEEFAAMMNTGTDWTKASRRYSQERFKCLNFLWRGESSQTKP